MSSLWLMYHDVYDRAPCAGIARNATTYHVSRDAFASHLDAIATSGLRVVSVGHFLSQPERDTAVLTFDDGWAGAFDIALPMLLERGWRATFFVTQDFVGRTRFCTQDTLRAAAAAGMEIGVHGVTHRMLSSCSHAEGVEEFRRCRQFLESLLGQAVDHASIPGGDFTPTVVAYAREASMKSLANSKPGVNSAASSPFDLRRVAIKDSTSVHDVERFCRFDLRRERFRSALLQLPRGVLGMKRYSSLRRMIMRTHDRDGDEVFTP